MPRPTWKQYFMEITKMVAKRSTCLRRKVGAIIVKDKRILATGYNGAPKGVKSCLERGTCLREELGIPSGQRHEICRGLHAEQNAIIQAAYYGVQIKDSVIYVTNQPCVLCAKMIINIDHHPDNTGYGDIAYLDSGASAVGEILSTYFFDVGYKIDREAAIQLYTAILTDTGRFRFNSTTRKTMEIAGKLIEAGADPRYISDSVYYSFSESTLHLIGKVFSRVRLFGGGKICLVAMDQNTLSENNFNPADTEGMAEYTLFGKGVVIGGLLKEVGKRRTKVSLRSRDGINVSELAHKYGGGGHNNASGFHIDLPLMEAQEKLLVDLKEIINGSV